MIVLVKGIGVDLVHIPRVRHLLETMSEGGLARTFTQNELAASKKDPHPEEYLAARFAAKEAVFKALAHLTPEKTFDLRIVETLNHEDGSPYIRIAESLDAVMHKAGVTRLEVSITTERDYAAAFVVACDDELT